MRVARAFTKITTLSVLIVVGLAFMLSAGAARASTSGVTYQGRILKPDGSPLSGSNVQFKLQIRAPDAGSCLMYEEMQALDMHASNGVFALTLNDGSGSRTDTTGLNLDRVFANRGSLVFDPTTCTAGNTYLPNASDGRNLVVQFKDETMATWEPMPAQRVNFVPFAFESKQISGFDAQSIVRVVDISGAPVGNLTPLSNANYTELLALIAGTSAQYTRQSAGAGSVVSTVGGTGNVASPAAGSVWLDTTAGNLKFYDGATVKTVGTAGGSVSSVTTGAGLTGGPITTSGTISLATLGAGGTGYKVTYDTYGRVTAAVALVEADIPTLSAAGKVVGSAITSGTIGGSTAINTTGTISSGAIVSSGLITSPSLSSTAIGTQSLQVFETTNTYKVTLQSPGSLTANYALTLPSTAGSSNQVLTTNGAGVLSWTTPAGTGFMNGGNTFGANSSIGNNDNFDLTVKTSNLPRITVQAGGNVGIGTTAPANSLSVGDGAASDGFIMARGFGAVGTNGQTLAYTGPGRRMFWYPKKGAFRSGGTDTTDINNPTGAHWDDANVGNYSTAFGLNCTGSGMNSFCASRNGTASGSDSVALGLQTFASGAAAIGMGSYSTAASNNSVAMGGHAATYGDTAVALGGFPTASGDYSFALGQARTGSAYAGSGGNFSMAVGLGNPATAAGNSTRYPKITGTNSFAFFMGDQTDVAVSANNVGVFMGGNVGIGTTAPRGALDVTGAILASPQVLNGGTTIDFSSGNIQYTTASCGSFQLNNLKDGGSYTFVVKGTTAATCLFTGYSDAGVTVVNVKMPPDNAATVVGKMTMFNVIVAGTDAFVAWSPGY